jgi:hypothetical protein
MQTYYDLLDFNDKVCSMTVLENRKRSIYHNYHCERINNNLDLIAEESQKRISSQARLNAIVV